MEEKISLWVYATTQHSAWKDNPFNNKEIKCFFLIISIRAFADGVGIDQMLHP